ncbi:MAG: AbrB/MazE/SpoVT family DNA-binding domain-containing protein [Acidobacteria bacterium]|nr:AbrB/MazE/SpoVT family DNA-binding domain-containing protein [Acidobacteriota bacterium]
MKITTKGQVTIPQRLRVKFGLLPHTDVVFEEADGHVVLRPVPSKRALVARRLREARGIASPGMSTDEVMQLTRGDE